MTRTTGCHLQIEPGTRSRDLKEGETPEGLVFPNGVRSPSQPREWGVGGHRPGVFKPIREWRRRDYQCLLKLQKSITKSNSCCVTTIPPHRTEFAVGWPRCSNSYVI